MNGNADEFAVELNALFDQEIEPLVKQVTQKIAMEALTRVVMRSPVDTGRFRGNWTVSVDAPNDWTSETVDPGGQGAIQRGSVAIMGIEVPKVIYVQNNLPYANRLENGWSQQAPAGVVAVTFSELQAFLK